MNWELIIGISSVIIALCALAFTILQSNQAQRYHKLSFKPHLTSWIHQHSGNVYTFEVVNHGLGPALIESFTLKIDNITMTGEGIEPIEKGLKILFPDTNYHADYAFMAKNYSMAAKERCPIVNIHFIDLKAPSKDVIDHKFNKAELTIEYKSVYEEKYSFTSS